MRKALEKILEAAKQNLVNDGYIYPVSFIFKAGQLVKIMPLSYEANECNDSKGINAYAAGIAASLFEGDYVAMVWDAAFRSLPSDTKPEDIDATEAPLTYPKSMRTECIVVFGVSVTNDHEDIVMAPYKGGEGEPVEFIKVKNLPPETVFKHRFSEIIRKGYAAHREKVTGR
jgi:hypothetical protein